MQPVGLNSENKIKFTSQATNNGNSYNIVKPNLLEKTPQQDELSLSTQENKKKRNKILITLGLICAGIGTAIAIAKGKAHKAELLNSIPDDLKTVFAKLKNKNGDEFVDEAYKEIVKHLGLEGIAPGKIERNGADGLMTITGGFIPTQNKIGYSDGFFTKLDRRKQINLLSHELKHCKQTTDFLRTEGIGIEEYAKAWAESCVQMELNNPFKGMLYKKILEKGGKEADELLENLRKKVFEQIKTSLEENYSEVLKMPKISADSDEGKKIHELFKGCKNYEGLGMLGFGSDNYKNNPLEVDAYAFGDKIEEFFTNYIFATK